MLIGESQQAIVFPVEYKLYICYQSGGGGAIITWRLKVVFLELLKGTKAIWLYALLFTKHLVQIRQQTKIVSQIKKCSSIMDFLYLLVFCLNLSENYKMEPKGWTPTQAVQSGFEHGKGGYTPM